MCACVMIVYGCDGIDLVWVKILYGCDGIDLV